MMVCGRTRTIFGVDECHAQDIGPTAGGHPAWSRDHDVCFASLAARIRDADRPSARVLCN